MGKKKQPFYRIVAADSRVARDGKYIENVGHYNPLVNTPDILVDEEKALYWLDNGAQPTDTVKSLFSKKGIIFKWSMKKKGIPEEKIDEEMKKWELLQIERIKKQEALEAQQKRESSKKTTEEEVEEKVDTAETVDKGVDESIAAEELLGETERSTDEVLETENADAQAQELASEQNEEIKDTNA